MGHVGWNNRIRLKVKEIGQELGIAAQNASRGLQVLIECGIVTQKQQGEYELHPELLHVGRIDEEVI